MTTTEDVTRRVVRIMQEIISSDLEPEIATQSDFAKEIGSFPTVMTRWVMNEGVPTVENIIKICSRFSVSADYLLMGRGDKYTGKVDKKDRLARIEEEMLEMKRTIDQIATASRNSIMREQLKKPGTKSRNRAA